MKAFFKDDRMLLKQLLGANLPVRRAFAALRAVAFESMSFSATDAAELTALSGILTREIVADREDAYDH